MKTLVRILASLPLLAIAGFCVFGFLASFEPGNGMQWKVGYAALGWGCVAGAIALLPRRRGGAGPSASHKSIVTYHLLIAAAGLFFLAVLILWLWATLR
jgi:hypothetical protein